MEMLDEFLTALHSWHTLVACILLMVAAVGALFWIRRNVRPTLDAQLDALTKSAGTLGTHAADVKDAAKSVKDAAESLTGTAQKVTDNFATIKEAVEGTFGTAPTRLGETMRPRSTDAELQSQRAHELRVVGFGATAELTKAGFQALLVINGGAIVAVLTLLGTVWSADDAAAHASLLPVSIAAFVFDLGLV